MAARVLKDVKWLYIISMTIKFDVFGKKMSVQRNNDEWHLFLDSGMGTRARVHDVVIPSELTEDELTVYLDDIYHEYANEKNTEVIRIE